MSTQIFQASDTTDTLNIDATEGGALIVRVQRNEPPYDCHIAVMLPDNVSLLLTALIEWKYGEGATVLRAEEADNLSACLLAASSYIDRATNVVAPPVTITYEDPELTRLLAEEEEIERKHREGQ